MAFPLLPSLLMGSDALLYSLSCDESLDLLLPLFYYETRQQDERVESYEEILHNKNSLEFFQLTRVTKETHAFLLDIIRQHYTSTYRGGNVPVDAQEALDVTLIYLGSKATFREIAALFRLSQNAVHGCVQKIIKILCNVGGDFVKWPSAALIPTIEREFRDVAGLPGVIGALDGTHIPIKAPKEMQTDYINRKQTHSIVLLATCDPSKRFTYIDVGFPGSADDNRVFTSSDLYSGFLRHENAYFPSPSYHIIGDAAFSPSCHVKVPYKDTGHLTQSQVGFNKKLSKTSVIIEHAFEFLKARFRRLLYVDADIDKISSIVTACCVLHNITLDFPEEEVALLREGPLSFEEAINPAAVFSLPPDTNANEEK